MQITCHPLLWTVGAVGKATLEIAFRANRPALAFLLDHVVRGQAVLPAAAMLEMAAASGKVRRLATLCRYCLPAMDTRVSAKQPDLSA